VCHEEIATSTADISIVKECSLSKYTVHWFALVLLPCTYLTVSTLMYWSVFPLLDLTWINLAICLLPFELNRVPKQTHLRPLIPIRPSISAYSPRTTVQTMRGPKPRHRHIVVKRTDVQDDGRTVPRTGRRAGTPCWRILPRVIGAKVPIG
jgi:hypothetical protein